MTVCLLAGLHKYYSLDQCEKNQMGLGLTSIPLKFENDLDHRLVTKNNNNNQSKWIMWMFPLTYYCVP